MRILAKIAIFVIALAVLAVVGLAGWLYVAPPALIRVGAAYSAKMVCSNVFLADRDATRVLAEDVQAPGHPLLGYIRIEVDDAHRAVSAALLGLFGRERAVMREGLGCTVVSGDGLLEGLSASQAAPADTQAPWPEGEIVAPSQNPELAAILADDDLTGPGMRAVVVVKNGRIVGERYGEGFSAVTPLLGWSMTKTVTAAIIGTVIAEGKLAQGQEKLLEIWNGDERSDITLADLMAMSSGLAFNEDYGDVTDVTRMLYLEPDMAGFAAAKPLAAEPGTVFSYSSGTTLILSRLWQDALGEPQAALDWPREALFDRIGMASAVLEADASGTFVGSSYLYATARDWARFGQLLLQEGRWNGADVLPFGYVAWMRQAAPASDGAYGRGQLWLHGPRGTTPEGTHADAGFDLPEDAFWLLGHDGQTVTVLPSQDLVVVRLGLTPSKLGYKPQALVEALVEALP
ncbi:serine hydrolase [Nitratireductor sp. StC3]|uniref:serine hydrolase domain-containing protein n=1 Tax=Nitratireductor sp. StC3 TaxID=2126741 RepID=UPI000D0D9682|nr:serine hydrolase [Nitratireductor sp. StC3]PSM17751.1 6-aminohexanoate hydrolase [Nitratireductor sp. StC3]